MTSGCQGTAVRGRRGVWLGKLRGDGARERWRPAGGWWRPGGRWWRPARGWWRPGGRWWRPARGWWRAGGRSGSLARRFTGYGAGSVIASITSELAFAAAYGWGHSGTTWASVAGFVGGAIPNYVLNRRWAWSDRRGRGRRAEIALYAAVSLASFLAAVFATHWAQTGARQVTGDHGWRVVLIAGAYLAVSGLFFLAKFVIYELVVFTPGPGTEPAGEMISTPAPPPAPGTTRAIPVAGAAVGPHSVQ
ncbi:MAG: GtrA family protein [Acidimicrobiales bacterium]